VPAPAPESLKIAVASSGLGHIRRGVETWADDLGAALRRRGLHATTFQGSRSPGMPADSPNVVIPCLKRFAPDTERLARALSRVGGWRFHMGSGYEIEQTTFALNLWRRIGRSWDILHVQDPIVAQIFESLRRSRLCRPRVILGHGTEEDTPSLQKLSFLQHLAPNYLADWEPHRPARQLSFAVPNFVDTERFSPPADAAAKHAARATLGLSPDTLIFLSVGALKKHHKRVDYLMHEFAAWRALNPGIDARLVVLGAREKETDEILALRDQLDPQGITLIENLPRERVLTYLQAADVFTLASLHEMMPIAVLEALACGLPAACNADPTLLWMVGDAGTLCDISEPGGLATQFSRLASPAERAIRSHAARTRAHELFSEEAVVNQVLAMYQQVMAHR
jgi:1,2-diacylglycerol 3-alpha-glucosyltransferase